MECKKCGAQISDASKFCVYCGAAVETKVEQPAVETVVENTDIQQPDSNTTIANVSNDVVNDNLGETIIIDSQEVTEAVNPVTLESKDESLPINEGMTNVPPTNAKKDGKKSLLFAVIGGIVGIAVIAALVFMLMGGRNKDAIAAVEKLLGNFKNINSGSITASVELESSDGMSLVLSAVSKFERNNDNIKMQVTINKSMLTDELNMYLDVDKKNAAIYVQSGLIDLVEDSSSFENVWLNYKANFEELGIDMDELMSEAETEDGNIDLKKAIDFKHLYYVNKKDGLNHYRLVVDKALIQNIEKLSKDNNLDADFDEAYESVDEIGSFDIDLYIDSNDNLTKISIDLSKQLKDSGIDKAIISFEFVNMNNTKVTIPKEALNSTMSIDEYVYASYAHSDPFDEYDFDDDYYYDYDDDDYDFDFNSNFGF